MPRSLRFVRALYVLMVAATAWCAGEAHAQNLVELTFTNFTDKPVDLAWVDPYGQEVVYQTIRPLERVVQGTFSGHQWVVRDQASQQELGRHTAGIESESLGIGDDRATLVLTNRGTAQVEVFWVAFDGSEKSYGKLARNKKMTRTTGLGQVWVVRNAQTKAELQRITVDRRSQAVEIAGGAAPKPKPQPLPIVPALENLTRAQADAALLAVGLTPKAVPGGIFTDPAKAGRVIVQFPAAGSPAQRNDAVTYVYALSANQPTKIPVPALVNLTKDEAEAALRQVGLTPKGAEGGASSNPADIGRVQLQTPTAGEEVDPGAEVTFFYSAGTPLPATVAVPDLAGLTKEEAEAALIAAGLLPKAVDGGAAGSPDQANRVYFQSHEKGSQAAPGTEVTFVHSSATPPPTVTAVPGLFNLIRAAAETMLRDNRLKATASEGDPAPDPANVGRVYEQSPPPNSVVPQETEVSFKVYSAAPTPIVSGPGPIDASSQDLTPNIIPIANPDDSLSIAWLRDDGRTFISRYSGSNWSQAEHIEIPNALAQIGGFARDAAGNEYLLTAVREKAGPFGDANYRPGTVVVLKVPAGARTAELLADINTEPLCDRKIVNPLNPGFTGRMAVTKLSDGRESLGLIFTHNHAWDGSINDYHQTASPLLVGTDGQSIYRTAGWNIKFDGGWYHCGDNRLVADGPDMIVGWVWESGIALSKMSLVNGQGDWTGHRQIFNTAPEGGNFASPFTGHDHYTRLGGIVPTADGYLVVFVHGSGFLWNGGSDYKASDTTVRFVKVPRDFAEIIDPSTGRPGWNHGKMPSDFGLRTLAEAPGFSLRRARLTAVGSGKYAVVYERCGNENEFDFAQNKWVSKFFGSTALLIDGNGQALATQDLGDKVRIHESNDALTLPASGRAAWVVGDAAKKRMVLHTLDENLALQSYPLTVP